MRWFERSQKVRRSEVRLADPLVLTPWLPNLFGAPDAGRGSGYDGWQITERSVPVAPAFDGRRCSVAKLVLAVVALAAGCLGDNAPPQPQSVAAAVSDAEAGNRAMLGPEGKAVADKSKQAAFDREFRAQIERFTEPLVAALRTITAAKPPAVVEALSFEIQADWRKFPVYAFAMDKEALNEVYSKRPFKGPLLADAGPLVPDGEIDQKGYDAAGVATFESGARVLAEWFGECWHAAGGARFPIPAYINLHDSSWYYDLHARRWVRATEIGR